MLGDTELFMLNSNHEMMSGARWYFDSMDAKRGKHPARQRQEGSYFVLRGSKFQITGIDTDYHADSRYQEKALRHWLPARLIEGRAAGLINILVSANEPYEYGRRNTTSLFGDLSGLIGENVDLWFWGNTHYCALFDRKQDSPHLPFIGSCVGHAGFPYTRKSAGSACAAPVLFLETRARFPETTRIRQDMGNNGYCSMRLNADGSIELTYIDWMKNVRCRATLSGSPLQVTALEHFD